MTIMPCCYIIHSHSLSKFYVGATHQSPELRVKKHNNAFYGKNKFTAAARDWVIFLEIKVNSFEQALRIEKHIKRMKSKTYIQNLKKYPEMLVDLLQKTAKI